MPRALPLPLRELVLAARSRVPRKAPLRRIWPRNPCSGNEMTDNNDPVKLLAEYRRRAAPHITEALARFRSMGPSDQRELLFHLLTDISNTTRHLCDVVDSISQPWRSPGAAPN